MLANLWGRDRIVQEARDGRGREAIREIPGKRIYLETIQQTLG